jgi:hypothetical protein
MKKLGWAEEVFYRRLMSVVDDFGRYYADFGLLRAACYPRQLDKVSDPDIGKWLRACVDAALVRMYPAEDGESYLELLDFGQQVRAKKSKFPNPPADAKHLRSRCSADDKQEISNAHLDVSVSVSVSEDGMRARAADICERLRSAGMADADPSHPEFLKLVEAGATADELAAASKGKGFAYALKTAAGRRRDAAGAPPAASLASVTAVSYTH